MRLSLILAAVSAAFATAVCAAPPELPPAGIAIVGVDVLPMAGPARLADQTVLVKGDEILAVGARAGISVPQGFQLIEGKGRTLMPGLVDMHMHLSPDPGRAGDSTQRALAMTLANGVTTGRVMLGHPAHPAVRTAIERGEIAGPRLYLGAPALNDNNTPTAERARAAVIAAKTAGFDLMKVHVLTQVPVWEALQEEARKQAIPTAGHVTNAVGLRRAMAAGQQVEHLDSVFAELLPPEASREFGQFLTADVLDAIDRVEAARFAALARDIADSRNYHVPTLAAFERITGMREPFESMLRVADVAYVAPWIIEQWRARRQNLAAQGFTASDEERMGAVRRRMVKALFDAEVPIMAGSDTPHPFHVWGFGLVREVETLSAAGLGPMAALRSATVVPRDYLRSLPKQGSSLGWAADFGTVEPGARADLLLLDADPSRDLAALRSIAAVVAGGRLYDRSALESMLRDARASGKAQPRPGG